MAKWLAKGAQGPGLGVGLGRAGWLSGTSALRVVLATPGSASWTIGIRVYEQLCRNARICKAKLGFVNLWRLTC
jgi:hypothetical protein